MGGSVCDKGPERRVEVLGGSPLEKDGMFLNGVAFRKRPWGSIVSAHFFLLSKESSDTKQQYSLENIIQK